MKTNPFISISEKKLLKLLISLVLVTTITNLISIGYQNFIDSFRTSGIDFSISGHYRPSYVPFFRFFAILIFPFVFWARKFIFSTLITILGFWAFIYENYLCFRGYSINNAPMPFLEFVSYIAKPLDYFVFLLVSILLIWQISILSRVIFSLVQGKPQLK